MPDWAPWMPERSRPAGAGIGRASLKLPGREARRLLRCIGSMGIGIAVPHSRRANAASWQFAAGMRQGSSLSGPAAAMKGAAR